jgi:LPS export ABC transporter protein LptC
MPFRQILPTFLLLLAAALSGWLVIKSLEAPINQAESARNPDAYIFNVNAVKMDAITGTPDDQLYSPQMIHYPANNTTNMITPHLIVFNDNGDQPWNIYADKGQAQQGADIIQLQDNVRLLQAAGTNNQALTITTTAITIHPKQQYVENNQLTNLWQPSGTASSVGIRAWQKTGIINLLSQAKGHYQNSPKHS